MARYIRFQPTEWHEYISMRVELYGCYAGNVFFPYAVSALITSRNLLRMDGGKIKNCHEHCHNLLFNTGEHFFAKIS